MQPLHHHSASKKLSSFDGNGTVVPDINPQQRFVILSNAKFQENSMNPCGRGNRANEEISRNKTKAFCWPEKPLGQDSCVTGSNMSKRKIPGKFHESVLLGEQ